MFFFLIGYRAQASRNMPPFSTLIEVFIGLHLLAILIGVEYNEKLTLIKVVDFMLRILDSYLVYIAAFLAGTRYRYRNAAPFIKAIVIGSAFAVILNVIAILLGIGPGIWEVNVGGVTDGRLAGLYHDPGVLSNVAFSNAVFVVFMLHIVPRRSSLMLSSAALLIIADLYLIAVSKSRAGMLQMAIFGLVYLWVFQKGWRKIFAPIAAAVVIGSAVVVLDINLDELFGRFDSDVAVFEGEGPVEVGVTSTGEVSLGALEGLGNNRGVLWARALTKILDKPLGLILFGDFSNSIAHSDYVDVLSRTGLVGLITYLIIILGLTLAMWKLAGSARSDHDRTLYFMAFTLIFCYLFYSLPFRPLGYTTTSWYMWIVMGLAMARSKMSLAEGAAARAARQPRSSKDKEVESPPRAGDDSHPRRDGRLALSPQSPALPRQRGR